MNNFYPGQTLKYEEKKFILKKNVLRIHVTDLVTRLSIGEKLDQAFSFYLF
jgi:hypothetical protein